MIEVGKWTLVELGVKGVLRTFSGNELKLVVVDLQVNIRVYRPIEVETYRVIERGGGKPVRCLASGWKREIVALGCWDGSIEVWDIAQEKLLMVDKLSETVTALLVVKSGKLLVGGDNGGILATWDLNRLVKVCETQGHAGGISALAGLSSGRYLFSAAFDYSISAWETDTLKRCARIRASRVTSANSLSVLGGDSLVYFGLPTGAVGKVMIEEGEWGKW
jgi:WD40 repeat protein